MSGARGSDDRRGADGGHVRSDLLSAGGATGGGHWLTVANMITLTRLGLAPIHALAILGGSWGLAFACFWLAVLTDLADGRVARMRGEASPLGGLLDHSTDALFVSLGLAAVACGPGSVTALLPGLVALAFLQYTLDSRALVGRPLRASLLGRYNGIAYFVLLSAPVMREGLGLGWPSDAWVLGASWALVLSTLVSMLDRAVAFFALSVASPKEGPGS